MCLIIEGACPIDMFLISSEFVNSAGLFFDIIGASLIFYFGLSKRFKQTEEQGIYKQSWGPSKKDLKSLKKYRILSNTGICFLLFGFVLQIISNWI